MDAWSRNKSISSTISSCVWLGSRRFTCMAQIKPRCPTCHLQKPQRLASKPPAPVTMRARGHLLRAPAQGPPRARVRRCASARGARASCSAAAPAARLKSQLNTRYPNVRTPAPRDHRPQQQQRRANAARQTLPGTGARLPHCRLEPPEPHARMLACPVGRDSPSQPFPRQALRGQATRLPLGA